MVKLRLCMWCCLTLAGGLPLAALGTTGLDVPDPHASPVWQKILASPAMPWAGRAVTEASAATLSLDIPSRADDPAAVPVLIRSDLPLTADRRIEKVYLIVDNNPSPIAGVFTFHPLAGRLHLETRIRVETYTHVRAVAVMSDGTAMMAVKHVKASGGCTAPAGRDYQVAMANRGKMRLSLPLNLQSAQAVQAGQARLVQLMLSHPNESGLAMDQFSRLYPQAYYVRSLEVSYQGRPVLSADLDFSISENPHFRFYLQAGHQGLLQASFTDTQDKVFQSALDLASWPAGSPQPLPR